MILKIVSAALILFAVYMGLKQGMAMITGKPEIMVIFNKACFSSRLVIFIGLITCLSALLILFPTTFLWGNFLMAAGILLIICLHLADRDLKGVAIELPFFLLNGLIIYLQHPLTK